MDLITPGLGLIFWMTVTFSLVLFVLSKFAWKPILGAIKEREQSIENALSSAQKAKEEMEKLQSDNVRLLDEARLERDQILKAAQTSANTLISQAKEKASEDANQLIENARLAIQNEKAAALTEIKNLVGNLSIQIAEQIIKKELKEDSSQQSLVQTYLNEAKLN
jgi:F-type H+-transporting ATPase subunit b